MAKPARTRARIAHQHDCSRSRVTVTAPPALAEVRTLSRASAFADADCGSSVAPRPPSRTRTHERPTDEGGARSATRRPRCALAEPGETAQPHRVQPGLADASVTVKYFFAGWESDLPALLPRTAPRPGDRVVSATRVSGPSPAAVPRGPRTHSSAGSTRRYLPHRRGHSMC